MSQGVQFHYTSKVEQITTSGTSVDAVILDSGQRVDADCVVVCAGYETCYLLSRLGISLPMAPVKAYSLHIKGTESTPKIKYATHLDANVACLITPYKDADPQDVRVTGIRDLDGFNTVTRQDRVDALVKAAHQFLGDFDMRDVAVWSGVMAVSPDDFPIVGKLAQFDNLFVNA